MAKGTYSRRDFLVTNLVAGAWLAGGRPSTQPTDPTTLSLEEAARLVRSKSVSPVELVRAYLKRVGRYRELNAFITVTEELALAQAREREAELYRGRWRGPLHGIPIALKDNIDTNGILTTAASGVFADRIPEADAEVVRRLKAAGAVLIGKLNMHECAFGPTSAVSHYGAVHNPWKLDHIPGGSSGGSAAAVAARLCTAALGTDTGGSIRLPAAYCGIVGLKPTYGLVSIQGVIPLAWTMDHVGPMCQTVADAALLLGAIAGYDPGDTASLKAPLPAYGSALRRKTSGLRLGTPRALYDKLDVEIQETIEQALALLNKLTAGVREVQVPTIPDLPIEPIEAYTFHAEYLKAERTRALYQPQTRELLLSGRDMPVSTYVEARRHIDRLRREVQDLFSTVDLLIAPTTPELPGTIEEARKPPREQGPPFSIRNTRPFNVYGLPTISIPCGFSKTGLPIGLQISGPPLAEMKVLALARAYEERTDWHNRRPLLS